MNERLLHRGGSRRRIGVFTAFLVCVVTAGVGAEPTGPPDRAGDVAAIATNQGVSIDESANVPALEERAAGIEGEMQSASADSAVVPASDRRAIIGKRKEPLTVRPRGAKSGAERSAGGGVLQWYSGGVWPLVIVLGILMLLCWIVRRWNPSVRAAESGVLRTAARVGVGPKQQIVLVQLGRRYVLVGVCGDGMRVLSEIDDPDEVAELAARTGTSLARGAGAFDHQLLEQASNFVEPESVPEVAQDVTRRRSSRASQQLNRLLQRLRKLQS